MQEIMFYIKLIKIVRFDVKKMFNVGAGHLAGAGNLGVVEAELKQLMVKDSQEGLEQLV